MLALPGSEPITPAPPLTPTGAKERAVGCVSAQGGVVVFTVVIGWPETMVAVVMDWGETVMTEDVGWHMEGTGRAGDEMEAGRPAV